MSAESVTDEDVWTAVYKAAKRLCIPDMTVRQWFSRGFVPPAEWNKIVKAAVDLGFLIGHDTLEKQREKALKGKKK